VRIVQEVLSSVAEGMELRRSQEERWKGVDGGGADDKGAEAEDPFAQQATPHSHRQAFAVLGPAGSGKTSCIQAAIDQVAAKGGKVLITAPTGKLAATFRQKYPRQDVDTMHGAFALWKPLRQTLDIMIPYDLIVVEEIGQVSQEHFDRMMQLWMHAERLPTIVFVGDFWQLPGVDPSKAFDSRMWRSPMVNDNDNRD
jgi:ATP-dependent exoDNAse (exonuclease V) alpha subunit